MRNHDANLTEELSQKLWYLTDGWEASISEAGILTQEINRLKATTKLLDGHVKGKRALGKVPLAPGRHLISEEDFMHHNRPRKTRQMLARPKGKARQSPMRLLTMRTS